jgi:putative MATE family efflux protein
MTATTPPIAAKPAGAPDTGGRAKFLTGSTMRHIVVMTATATLGLMAIFIVDLANIYFLGLLGDVEITAAVGFASTILFFATSFGIGLAIAASALVSRAVGAGQTELARRLATHAHLYAIVISALFAVVMWLATPQLLAWLGATGRTSELARHFLDVTMASVPALAAGMCSSGVLRAVGDARRAMNVTLIAGIANAGFDVVLILGLGLGISGAAIAMVLSRLVLMGIGLYGVGRAHGMLIRPELPTLRGDLAGLNVIAVPAILTNLATPMANAYVTSALAPFGEGTMAAWAVLGRIAPVALCGLFALSGAVGPIMGQNLGARQFGRVRETMTNALIFCGLYTLGAWLLLAVTEHWVAQAFHATPDGARLIRLYCVVLIPFYVFLGAIFVANAAFNNLGKPHYATLFNWGRATLGTIPFVMLGQSWYGADGVLAGSVLGTSIFGIGAVLLSYHLITGLTPAAEIVPVPAAVAPGHDA